MVLRLIESDLHRLIFSTVKKVLKENQENNEILSNIVQSLNDEITPDDGTEGTHDKQISLDDLEIILSYEVEDGNVYIYSIEVYGEEGKLGDIEDNGMVANAIISLTGCDQYPFIKDDPTFRGGGF